jgi:hypothetical protein
VDESTRRTDHFEQFLAGRVNVRLEVRYFLEPRQAFGRLAPSRHNRHVHTRGKELADDMASDESRPTGYDDV